ncbi:hypothetical protein AVEN_178469-1 [Araneus ventricosus]|uniref:Uncharacterized protein n=1 Tax=Araneus ventricosus TaxID=182803 RepID=A0A4Y2CDQ9_ARAVE|nr:hypothetical protein AVEN_178469-1 [Araneus ventricosus]
MTGKANWMWKRALSDSAVARLGSVHIAIVRILSSCCENGCMFSLSMAVVPLVTSSSAVPNFYSLLFLTLATSFSLPLPNPATIFARQSKWRDGYRERLDIQLSTPHHGNYDQRFILLRIYKIVSLAC